MECKIHKFTVDVLVIAKSQVLLVRYKDIKKHDDQEGWSLPEKCLDFAEHPSEGARHILQDQISLILGDIALGYIESRKEKDDGIWHLIFHHKVELDYKPTVNPSTNIKSFKWFLLDKLPERSSIAYGGRAINVIKDILKPSQYIGTLT